jgi:hypothetical protein
MSRATISGIENGTVPKIGIRKILFLCAGLGLELLAQEKTKRPLHSIECTNNAAYLRWNEDDGCVYLTASWAIKAVLPNLRKDEWLWSALQSPVKYCRIVRADGVYGVSQPFFS